MAECESFECLRDLSGLSIREKKKSISRVVYYTINNFSVFSLCKSFLKELKRDFLKIKKIKNIYILLKKHSSLSLSGTRGGATRHRQSFDLKCKRPNRSGGRPPGTHDRLCFSFRFFFSSSSFLDKYAQQDPLFFFFYKRIVFIYLLNLKKGKVLFLIVINDEPKTPHREPHYYELIKV